MTSVNETNANLQMREIFGLTLAELGAAHEDILVLDADLHTSTRITYFKDRFPNRFIQAGIAEQNLFGLAAGMALAGFTPFPCTFASFVARKSIDQFALSICFPALNVKVPGSYVGVPTSKAGASHNSFEDIAFMRTIPNLKVADPGDAADMRAVMKTAYETPGPVYFRVVRYALPDMFSDDHTFEWGKGRLIRKGTDVTLFGTGMMTDRCIKAAVLLEKEGISAEVIHLASIKPIDSEMIVESVSKTGCTVTAENASIIAGFGAAVAEVLVENFPVPLKRIGVRDQWIDSGEIEELFTFYKMQPEDIAAAAVQSIRMKEGRSK
jgi:transketolase